MCEVANYHSLLTTIPLHALQLSHAFTSLAETSQSFYESGMEHYKSATKMVACVQSIGGLVNNSLGQSVSAPMTKVNRLLSACFQYGWMNGLTGSIEKLLLNALCHCVCACRKSLLVCGGKQALPRLALLCLLKIEI